MHFLEGFEKEDVLRKAANITCSFKFWCMLVSSQRSKN